MKLSEFILQAEFLRTESDDPRVVVMIEGCEVEVDCIEQDCKTGLVMVSLI